MRRRERLRLGSEEKFNDNKSNDHQHDEYAQPRGEDPGSSGNTSADARNTREEEIYAYAAMYGDTGADDSGGSDTAGVLKSEQEERRLDLEEKEKSEDYTKAKRLWKIQHPDQNIKFWKDQYIQGKVDNLPWEETNYIYKENGEQKIETSYTQNSEQSSNTIWQRLKNDQN